MENKGPEKRECGRFAIPGATVSFKLKEYIEEFSPIEDISRGGLKFLCKKAVDLNTELILKISIPDEKVPFTLQGVVHWISFDREKNSYQIGIQFNPYGEKLGQNYPGNLVKIIALEQKFSAQAKSGTEKYEID